MKTKKGFIEHLLVSLLICIIVFVPACLTISKLYNTNEKAQDNYGEFLEQLNTFAEHGQSGERKSILLILDEATAIVYYQIKAPKVAIDVNAKAPNTDYSIDILKPGQCDDTKNCLCLLRDSDFETTVFDKGLKGKITVTPKKVICVNINYNLEVETCSIGEGTLVNSYTCSNGFMIERNLAKKSSVLVGSYYEIPRRTVLYFNKENGNTIKLLGNYGGTDE